MSLTNSYLHPATLTTYDKINRTAQVTIEGLTDGLPEGITAMIAYPIGDDDLDTERELLPGADVWVFFEQGDTSMPVIAFYRRHGKGRAVIDTRRIRQKNIELLARATITLRASDFIHIEANEITIKASKLNIEAETNLTGNITQIGNYAMTGNQTITGGQTINGDSVSYGNQTINGKVTVTLDVVAGGKSLKSHKHDGVETGGGTTGSPQ